MLAFLFLVVIGLLIWVGRLHSRVADLEARDAEASSDLASLRQRLDKLAMGRVGTPAEQRAEHAPIAAPARPASAAEVDRSPQPTASAPKPPAAIPLRPAPSTAASPASPRPPAPPMPPVRSTSPTPPALPAPPAAPLRAAEKTTPGEVFSRPAEPAPAPFDWEELIGVRLGSWVAGIALAVAAVLFLGYSMQQGWLQPPVRMAIGLAVGVGLLVACELKAARRYPVTANALDGAAIVILFSTFFASYRLWQLVGPVTAFALLALVTLVAALLSIRRDSVFIALLGLVGGFSTPALLSSGHDNPFGLFGYLLMLNAGLGWVAYRKRWPALVGVSLVFTTIYQWGWVATFLTPGKLPAAAAVFLAFPILGFASLGLAGRAGALDPGTGSERRSWFQEAASLNAALPLLFALFMATSQAYGEHSALLFGFLLCLDAGLFAVALWRGPAILHLVGGIATLLVFVTWTTTNYVASGAQHSPGFPAILGFVALFVVFYLVTGLTARHGPRRLNGSARLAVYSAPLLLFMFPALAGGETSFASPALPFSVLFVLLGACAAFAVVEEEGIVYFVGAFLALAAEAAWSSRHLSDERLLPALGIYALFGLVFIGVPVVARKWQKPLAPAWLGGLLLLLSVALLFFLSSDRVATASLWGLAVLLGLLNVALMVEGRASRLRWLTVSGSILSWLVLGSWWVSGALTAQIVPALLVVAGFTMLTLVGHLWVGIEQGAASDETQAGMALALVGHLFLLFVAVQPSLSVPPWPMLAVVALVDLAIGAAALYTRRAELHAAALGFSQVILIVWASAANPAPWPTVAMVAAALVGAFGLAWSVLASRRVEDPTLRDRFDMAAAIALVLGQVLLVEVSVVAGEPGVATLTAFHVLLLVGLLALASVRQWHSLAIAAAGLTWAATWIWQASHPGMAYWRETLVLATPIYLLFLSYPLVLGRRIGTGIAPHVAAVMASASFFHVARLSLVAAGYGDVIGALPLLQAGLLGALLVGLLRIEPPDSRTLGRLALVAGALLAFVTVAIPLQLEKEWITIGWALEGAALAWLFRRIPHRGLFWCALGLLAVVFVRLALNPEVLIYQPRSEVRILNWYLYTYLTGAAAMLTAGWMFSTTDDGIVPPLRGAQVAPAAATILLFILLNIEIADFYATGSTITFDLSAGLAQNLTYTLGWAVFAVCLLSAGIVLRSHAARLSALVLLTATVFKGFLSDVARLDGLYRVMSFVGLAICLSLVAVVLQRFVLSPKAGDKRE